LNIKILLCNQLACVLWEVEYKGDILQLTCFLCSVVGPTAGHHCAVNLCSTQWNSSSSFPWTEPRPQTADLYAATYCGCVLVCVSPCGSQLFPYMPVQATAFTQQSQ